MASRMVPVWQVFDRFPRLVRDSARSLGKQIEFTIEGKEIELDRSMLDEIGDPVVHLLRNAIDHGFETASERVAAGKPPAGKLVLSAAREQDDDFVVHLTNAEPRLEAFFAAAAAEEARRERSSTESTP